MVTTPSTETVPSESPLSAPAEAGGEAVDVAIVGAGAAGLAAAIFALEAAREAGSRPRVLLLEAASRPGAKILVAGGGRCNVTHGAVGPGDFAGPTPVVRSVLKAFDHHAARRWFEALGVPLKVESTGKLFPVSDRARDVLDALLARVRQLGGHMRCASRVRSIEPARKDGTEGFVLAFDREGEAEDAVTMAKGPVHARFLVLATGGCSLPRSGSTGQGWRMAESLGHTVTDTYPALVPLKLSSDFFHASLSGISQQVTLITRVDGKVAARRSGSMLWTHFGVSGPVVMDASRDWTIARGRSRAVELRLALWGDEPFEKVDTWLVEQCRQNPRSGVATFLGRHLPARVAEALCRGVGLEPAGRLAELPRESRRKLVHAMTDLPLPVVADRGWNAAEVTAGGVPLSEVDHRTMHSRLVPGLYLVGEMLDCDGRIGGFNFQWAWSTGYIAGKAVARSLAGAGHVSS